MTEDQFFRLKDKCDTTRQARDRQEGALALLLSRLKKEFGCDDVEQGEEKLAELRKDHRKLSDEANEKWKELRERYPSLFEE